MYVLVCFVPLALAADVSRPLRGSAQRAVRLLGGVILAQPVIALCLAIGGAMLGSADTAHGPILVLPPDTTSAAGGVDLSSTVGVLLTGVSVIVLAVFAPFVVLKMFPVGDADATAGAKTAAAPPMMTAARTAGSALSGGATSTASMASSASASSLGPGAP